MSNLLKLVAFDCDGVLFDSRPANIAFYNAILGHFGQPSLVPEGVDYVHSRTFRESLEYIFRESEIDLGAVLKYCAGLDSQHFVAMMVEEPHLRDFLGFLRPTFYTAVATNRSTTTHLVFQYHRLEDLFDLVVSAQDVTRPKPHPESFWRILTHFGLKPEEALYIGDSLVDQEFCLNAGVPLVAYRNPVLRAAHYLNSFADGPALIQALTGGKGRR